MDILAFISPVAGYGSGYSNGYGDADGYGNGSGFGFGSGYGSGYSNGNGSGNKDGSGDGDDYGYSDGSGSVNGHVDGSGFGYGRLSKVKINGHKIYLIDEVNTIITSIKGNYAKGFIVNADMTLTPTFIARQEVDGYIYFAHGETLHEAYEDLQNKINVNLSEDERIKLFLNKFKLDKKYSANEFYKAHQMLTGSCRQGKDSFISNNNIDMDKYYTVNEFLDIAEKGKFGANIIRKVKEITKKKELKNGKV